MGGDPGEWDHGTDQEIWQDQPGDMGGGPPPGEWDHRQVICDPGNGTSRHGW